MRVRTIGTSSTRSGRSGLSGLLGTFVLLIPVSTAMSVAPALAQSREQRQLMADMRMMQEQNQILQNMLGSIAEALKAVDARIEARINEQANNTGKALADQKLVIDTLSNNVREIREKLDDNTVRLGTLNTEVDALRQGIEQLSARPAFAAPGPTLSPETAAPGGPEPPLPGGIAGADPGTAAAPNIAPPPVIPIGTSPQKLFDAALADYRLSQYELAISGFESYLKYFPKAERAGDAQVYIGNSYFLASKYEQAVEAYDTAIRTYPDSAAIAEAYYRKGMALRALKRLDEARAAFEYVVKTYPETDAASLARQALARPEPAQPGPNGK